MRPRSGGRRRKPMRTFLLRSGVRPCCAARSPVAAVIGTTFVGSALTEWGVGGHTMVVPRRHHQLLRALTPGGQLKLRGELVRIENSDTKRTRSGLGGLPLRRLNTGVTVETDGTVTFPGTCAGCCGGRRHAVGTWQCHLRCLPDTTRAPFDVSSVQMTIFSRPRRSMSETVRWRWRSSFSLLCWQRSFRL